MMLGNFIARVDEDVINKFEIALNLSKENRNDVFESFMNNYIASVFSKISKEHSSTTTKGLPNMKNTSYDYGKAKRKIPKWAANSNQYNHRILRAFFQIEKDMGFVPYSVLEKRCADNDSHPDINVPTFRSNFDQMKVDNSKSHGKVFEVKYGNVELWDYTKERVLEYKNDFVR
ncbi:MAG: hypothetical protein HN948_03130 [Clostridia bacterium]|nr:hypothetical protein [Clostridia bacterium]MBT7121986.1 hypothetical protein [Clostridia bacterium]